MSKNSKFSCQLGAECTLEVLLIRVFDVILLPNTGYVVITCAMFAFGLSGVYATIFPVQADRAVDKRLAILALLFALTIFLLRPGLNSVTLVYEGLSGYDLKSLIGRGLIYMILLAPFFISGLIFSYLFSANPSQIRNLYFWDLAGAALGCVAFLPFFRMIGPGGLMFCATAGALVSSALFISSRKWSAILVSLAIAILAIPFINSGQYYDFLEHKEKRGVETARKQGRIELTEWDPISKIDVVDNTKYKTVAYDGGSQSSTLFKFDGDLDALRQSVLENTSEGRRQFWSRGVLASHYLKRDTDAEVLIFGSAAGQETKAALLYNASRVDGIELVDAVVRLGKTTYADYIGNIFNDPRVNNQSGEGRSFLRSTDKKYDIIQIFSNHTSSYIAGGLGAANPVYLQTAEAYEEYFSHLKPDGILHINHHLYPRMVTTAALAWKRLGRADFQRHVLVFERQITNDTLPTLLIKLSPWTDREVREITKFFDIQGYDMEVYNLVVNPLDSDNSFLSPDFFSGDFPEALADNMDYRAQPSTDDWPFINILQKDLKRRVEVDPEKFLNSSMVSAINGRTHGIAGELSMFAYVGLAGLFFSAILIFVPIKLSKVGKVRWKGKCVSMSYFACLGAGFIIIELVFVQILMRLIGFPLYTYSVVIFTMLLSAAMGSLAAHGFNISPKKYWAVPFLCVLTYGAVLLLVHNTIIEYFLTASLSVRILSAAVMLFPLGFFMGMPFSLGILSLRNQPHGAIAWAWGMNGLFTVLGGMMTGLLSIFYGFNITFLVALLIYMLSFALFAQLQSATEASEDWASPSVEVGTHGIS